MNATSLQIVESAQDVFSFCETATFDEWAKHGREIYHHADQMTWHLADWAAFGDRKFGKLKAFCESSGANYHALKAYAMVAGRVSKKVRQLEMSFAHHFEVARLPEAKQKKWLKRAKDENLTTGELRKLIRDAEGDQSALISDGTVTRTIGTKYDEVKSFLLGQPSDFWNEDTKRIWKERLRPMVEFYQTL